MVEDFDLRWMALADRYEFPNGKPRSIEDLKGRYYSVARQLLVGREGTADTVANNVLVKHPYSVQNEKDRKEGLEILFKRNPQQDAEEEEVLQEAIKIEAKRRAESGARRGAANIGGATGAAAASAPAPITISEFTNEVPVGTPPLFDAEGNPALPTVPTTAEAGAAVPRVVTRAAHTRDLVFAMLEGIQPQKYVDVIFLQGIFLLKRRLITAKQHSLTNHNDILISSAGLKRLLRAVWLSSNSLNFPVQPHAQYAVHMSICCMR